MAHELGELQRRSRADDRRRKEEREPRSVLVREAHKQAAAHRRARAREPRDQCERLGCADGEGVPPSDLACDPRIVVGLDLNAAAAEQLGSEEQEAVREEEDRGGGRRREHMSQPVLEQKTENPRGNRPDDEQPAELRVGVVGSDLPVPKAPAEALDDSGPVAPEETQEHERGREVRGDEKGDEVAVVLVDVPTEELRQDHAVAEARDRKELRHSLQKPEHGRLGVGDERGDDQAAVVVARSRPLWNHAKTRSARPRRNAAIPCFTW